MKRDWILPDGKAVDKKTYFKEWDKLAKFLIDLTEGEYELRGFDPDILLSTKSGHTVTISYRFAERIRKTLESRSRK